VYDVVIIGAGASGLMVASKYKEKNIALIDTNSKIAQKIKISGGGKCNITNAYVSEKNYLGNPIFIKEVLETFDQNELLSFLKVRGCEPILKKEYQYFCKDSADEIINILKKETDNAALFLNQSVLKISKKENFLIQSNKQTFEAKNVVVASGGLSYPKIGASPIAYDIAKSFGHTINTTSPALVGFTVQKDQFWMKDLSGISMRVQIKVGDKNFCQDLLFAHKGISGPVVLNSSLYWQKGLIEMDFLPNVSLKKYLKNSNKLISTALPLPKRFIKSFLSHIDLEDKSVSQMNEEEVQKLSQLKNYTFAPAGNFGYSKAEVTRGGVSTDEIDPKTMMSKLVKNLYFVGECLDVTGALGGYNFQWAFSSAQKLTINKI
jgi:predicted Rossmann fold flavoprotein